MNIDTNDLGVAADSFQSTFIPERSSRNMMIAS